MAKRKSPWHVERSPAHLDYAFFISHVDEDADEVRALKSEITSLSGRGGRPELSCYLDTYNWEIGNDPGRVIRHYLLRSEYLVAWVTPAYLEASRRGWIWFEFAYAELIELSLNYGCFDHENTYIIPMFRSLTLDQLERSPMVRYWSRQLFHPVRTADITQVAQTLVNFYEQEARKRRSGLPNAQD